MEEDAPFLDIDNDLQIQSNSSKDEVYKLANDICHSLIAEDQEMKE